MRTRPSTAPAGMTATPETMILLDPAGVVRSWNAAAAQLWHCPAETALGAPLAACRTGGIPMSASFRYLLPFIGVMALIMFLLILFPGLMTLMSLGM